MSDSIKNHVLHEIKRVADEIFAQKYLDAAPFGTWITAKKEHIPIQKMGNGHLRNAILMLKRKGLTEHAKYGELLRETERRGWTPDKGDFFLDGAL